MAKHKITNNFKLPPFPVYVPSTDFTTTLQSFQSTDSGSNNEASKSKDTLDSKSYMTTTNLSVSSSESPSSELNGNTTSSVNKTLSLGRINPYLYQSESSLTNNSNNVTSITSSNEITASYTSPFQSNYNNISSSATLSKSSTQDSYVHSKTPQNLTEKSSDTSYKFSTDYNKTTTNNETSTTYTTSASESMYRVQYSATNPFLDPLDKTSSSTTTTTTTSSSSDNNDLSSIFAKATATARSGTSSLVSEIARKFEKFDFEDDLK